MSDYVILSDSGSDLPQNLVEKFDLTILPLSVTVEGKEYKNYPDEREISNKDFFALLREGKTGKTSAINLESFLAAMEPILQAGKDLLYLGFSSGLSGTYQVGAMAAQELAEKYPERKIYAVDTLCASLGQGLLLDHAARLKAAGKTIEEVKEFVENNRLNLVHWFTVDDLNHLKRGGRVSATTALVGSLLSIKPILHVDDEGHLISMEKVRGRKAAIHRLAEKLDETMFSDQPQPVYICHGDCPEEAEYLGSLLREKKGVESVTIGYIGPVIGAHAGPGTLAVFYLGSER